MIRDCDINEISDGRKYTVNDMAKCDAGGCKNCFKCCTGMGKSIILDPYDIYKMKKAVNMNFQQLLDAKKIELNIVDGLIMPNISMVENNQCGFLEDGRCSIHQNRPGICRLFPLGRLYENGDFTYIVQKNQCINETLVKTKIKKWIAVDDVNKNHIFINTWHYFIKDVGEKMIMLRDTGRSELINDITMFILNVFYVQDYNIEETAVYDSFCDKIEFAKKEIAKLI